jgi:gliding motility-associated-like protein
VNDLTTGCTIATSVFTVASFDLIDAVAAPTAPVTCFGDTDGALEINVSGYAGPYNYEVFDNLGASVLTGTGNTTLLNPQTITGLSGGNYSILVTEIASPFCAVTSNVITIASPSDPLTLVAAETANVSCSNNQGTITALASGGWGSYEYELTGAASVPYSINGAFINLSAGNYTVNVRDAGGCIISQNVTLVIPAPISATVLPSTNLLTCFGDTNASITVSNVIGGQGGNFSYTLNKIAPTVSSSGPQSSPVFSGLGAGTYNVVITDGYNCAFTSANIVIAEPTKVQSTLVKSTSQTCLTGTTLTLSATGGTGIYTYSDTASFATILGSFASSTTITVAPGTYVYYVRDANNCYADVSNQIKIDPLPALVVTVDATNAFINCAGDNTGVIVATAQGGLGNYIYTLQDASGINIPGAVQNSPGIFTDLFAGTYQIRVDSNDCTVTSSVITISEPALPLTVSYSSTDVTCNGANNGLLQINASGGTGIIKYAISPQLNQFFETSTFENLAPGTYDVIVQDEFGCFVYFPVTITEPNPLFVSVVPGSLIPEVCSGDMDGEFSIDISGGTEPYSVSLDDINGVYTIGIVGQTQFDFTGLEGGDHVVYVRDNVGCESEWNITFPESVLINAEVEIDYCTNNTDALSNTVAVYIDDSTVDPADIDYSLDGGVYQTSSVFNDVTSGNHIIYVRHTNTCEKAINFDVEQFDPLQIAIDDGDLNEIVVTTTGGSGIYEYELTNLATSTTESFGSTESYFIYNSGDYTVTVTDSNGCIASATRYFEFIDVCITNYFTPNDDGYLDEWGPGCTNQYQNLTYVVLDRYGRKVADLRAGQKWDGKYNGSELPSGDYWYVIRLNDRKDNRQFVGHFTLYR